MPQVARIIIADRSELAGNIFRLLLKFTGASIVARKRFEEARPHFFRREKIDLAIFNSNIFGKKFEDIFKSLLQDEPLRNAHKIFICREGPTEDEWRERLERLKNSQVVVKPFHPDEFASVVKKCLGGAR